MNSDQGITELIESRHGLSPEESATLVQNLKPKCLDCKLLFQVLASSDLTLTAEIIDDVAATCPMTVGYMGAVVTVCTVDQRLEQGRTEEASARYKRGES